ncbi:Fur family transcriptional regulator [Maricurvus nonylphenolicus]|uniref:Fur family transcriptional regulator n=1 Tax=Maricurvus nonylphenolicus TaxID=1008307 RepID=UPI0036F198B4
MATLSDNHPLACRQHDHEHCIETALQTARDRCLANGARLTALREQVLTLIWQNHKPLGAYALMDMLASQSTKRVAPPTVYRALDFLLEQQLIHRIHSLNAFIGCTHPNEGHPNNFLICQQCGVAIEFNNNQFQQAVSDTAKDHGFTVSSQAVELVGLCVSCQESAANA